MYVLEELHPIYNIPDEVWKALDFLDIISLNHSVRVCEICRIVEKELGYTDTKLSEAGLVHDIGKIFVPEWLLDKRGKLSALEREIIDFHSYFSYRVLKYNNMDDEVCQLALYHHSMNPKVFTEKDAKFSPVSKELFKKCKVLKTIDIYEALTTDRSYHRGISYNSAIDVIISMGDYDMDTINALKKHHREFE